MTLYIILALLVLLIYLTYRYGLINGELRFLFEIEYRDWFESGKKHNYLNAKEKTKADKHSSELIRKKEHIETLIFLCFFAMFVTYNYEFFWGLIK